MSCLGPHTLRMLHLFRRFHNHVHQKEVSARSYIEVACFSSGKSRSVSCSKCHWKLWFALALQVVLLLLRIWVDLVYRETLTARLDHFEYSQGSRAMRSIELDRATTKHFPGSPLQGAEN